MEKLRKENKRQKKEIQRLKDLNKRLTSELASAKKKLKEANIDDFDKPLSDSDVGSDDNSDSDIEIIEIVDGYEEFTKKQIKTFKKLDMTPEVDVHKILVDDPLEFVAKVTIHKDTVKVRLPKRKNDNKFNNESIDIVDIDDESDLGWKNTVTTKRQRTNKKKTATKRRRTLKKKMDENKDNEESYSDMTNKRRQTRKKKIDNKINDASIDIIDLAESESDSGLSNTMATKRRRTKVSFPKKKTIKKKVKHKKKVKKHSFKMVDIEESDAASRQSESDVLSRQSESDVEKVVERYLQSSVGLSTNGRSKLVESDQEDKFDNLFNFKNETLAGPDTDSGIMKKQLDPGKHLEDKIKEIKENKIKRDAEVSDVVVLI